MCYVANPAVAPTTVEELVALAKKTGEGHSTSPRLARAAIGHLAGAWLENLAGIKLTHIAYNGGAPALIDVIAGRVPIMFDLWSSAKPYVADGRLKVLAVVARNDCKIAPQYPTLAKRFTEIRRQCLSGPRRAERRAAVVIEKISADIRSVVSSPAFAKKVRPLAHSRKRHRRRS